MPRQQRRRGSRSVRRPTAGRTAKGQPGKVGYAVIGLGHIAQVAVLPAFAHARGNSRLVALVSGDARKRNALAREYGARAYDYDALEECLASEDVDVAYIALPNDQHLEYVE